MLRFSNYFFFGVLIVLTAGCATLPYKPSGDLYPNPEPFQDEPQITRGEPNTIADSLGHYVFSLPEKLILWNWNMGRHTISPETEESIKQYLAVNELKEVKVRLNEYAPFGEWKRLTNNQGVGAGWRYTLGTITWLFYTIFPGRIFGGDHYNPFTNTISLYSDLPVVALHEGGHAKDTAANDYKGSYAALRILPFYALRDEAVASNDVVSYVVEKKDIPLEKSAYKVLYPAYGTYVGGGVLGMIPGVGPIGGLIGAIPGHIIGRIKASNVEDPEQQEQQPEGATDEQDQISNVVEPEPQEHRDAKD